MATAALCGCATIPAEVAQLNDAAAPVEIESAPFFPQEEYQCGPAALATVLVHSGVDVSLDAITDLAYLPGRQGSLQTELIATARSFDRIPYHLDGTLASLHDELSAGRPVLVLQNLAVSWAPRWHYAVVVGIEPEAGAVILRSGTDRRRITKSRTFLYTWRRGDYWAIALLAPGELPANADKNRYFAAIADLEAAGRITAAAEFWGTAHERWPNDRTVLFGMAHTAFQLGDLASAEHHYRALLKGDPDFHAARNNLAYTLAAQGDLADAVSQIKMLLSGLQKNDPLRAEYEASLRELMALP